MKIFARSDQTPKFDQWMAEAIIDEAYAPAFKSAANRMIALQSDVIRRVADLAMNAASEQDLETRARGVVVTFIKNARASAFQAAQDVATDAALKILHEHGSITSMSAFCMNEIAQAIAESVVPMSETRLEASVNRLINFGTTLYRSKKSLLPAHVNLAIQSFSNKNIVPFFIVPPKDSNNLNEAVEALNRRMAFKNSKNTEIFDPETMEDWKSVIEICKGLNYNPGKTKALDSLYNELTTSDLNLSKARKLTQQIKMYTTVGILPTHRKFLFASWKPWKINDRDIRRFVNAEKNAAMQKERESQLLSRATASPFGGFNFGGSGLGWAALALMFFMPYFMFPFFWGGAMGYAASTAYGMLPGVGFGF